MSANLTFDNPHTPSRSPDHTALSPFLFPVLWIQIPCFSFNNQHCYSFLLIPLIVDSYECKLDGTWEEHSEETRF